MHWASSNRSGTWPHYRQACAWRSGISGSASAASYKSGQIRVEYVLPKNPAHQPIYERLKQARALERIQTLLSPLHFHVHCFLRFLTATVSSNAWYDEGFVTVCYEYLADILKDAQRTHCRAVLHGKMLFLVPL